MDILELYKHILDFASMECDDEGYVFRRYKKELDPALDDGKRVVLPTPTHLKNPDNKLIFHPLSENILRGESECVRLLRRAINSRLNVSCFVIVKGLLMLAASPELHGQLNPDQTELMIKLKSVDKNTVLNFVNIGVKGMVKNADRHFVNIYLKRGGSIEGKRFSKVGICNFHFYNELQKPSPDNALYDVKVRAKDREMYKAVFDYIFPRIGEEAGYNYGSDCHVAPYLDALLKTALNIVSVFNDIVAMYGKFIDQDEMSVYNSEWVDEFDNLEKWLPAIRKIPMQSSGANTEHLNQENQRPQNVPMPQPPQAMMPGLMPGVQPPPPVRHTERGLDFNSLVSASPQLMQNTGFQFPMMAPGMNPMQMNPNARTPSWAMPQQPQYPAMMQPGFNQPMSMMGGYPNTPMQPGMVPGMQLTTV